MRRLTPFSLLLTIALWSTPVKADIPSDFSSPRGVGLTEFNCDIKEMQQQYLRDISPSLHERQAVQIWQMLPTRFLSYLTGRDQYYEDVRRGRINAVTNYEIWLLEQYCGKS